MVSPFRKIAISFQLSAISKRKRKKHGLTEIIPLWGAHCAPFLLPRTAEGGCATSTLPNNKAFFGEIIPAAPF
jgi:hypothetical protein